MATAVKPETIPWGKRITTHEAIPFYGAPGWDGLRNGQSWVNEGKEGECRHLASAHELLEDMVLANTILPPFWITTNFEEIFGTDTAGHLGRKDEAVMLAIQGGGIILESPESLQAAYTNRTPKGEPSVQQGKIAAALAGSLPNRQQVPVYTLQALKREDPRKLPLVYVIAVQLKELENTPSGLVKVDQLANNPFFVVRAGHPGTAEDFARTLQRSGVKEYGNHHALKQADPKNNPCGRVLLAGINHYDGLDGSNLIDNSARFVGVRRGGGAEGAAPRQQTQGNPPLEALAGLGTPVGNQGLIVVDGNGLTQEAYRAFTGQNKQV